jgi:O-antigen/teichoic acid export membrane protein
LRAQADQWVAALLFSLHLFASFTIASVLAPMVNLFRQSVSYAFLPSMSRLEAAGDIREMLELNRRANVMVGALVFPLFALAFVFAEELVSIVYTSVYVDAAPVMRVYIVGLAALVVELSSVTLLLRQGAFVTWLNLITLVVSVACNWAAARHFGLAGAAMGTVLAFYIDRFATLRRIAAHTGMPLRALQDWPALGLLFLAACVAAALAWVIAHFLVAEGPLWQMIIGGTFLVAAYAALGTLFGRGRGWLTAVGSA